MEFLKALIKKISPGVKKGIGIFISPDSTMEMVEYDYVLGEINNYSRMDFHYDSIIREINVENFEIVLQNILKKFDISSQIPITLSLPSIFINKKILPSDLANEEVQTALVSETEKNYLFKKTEPKVSWNVISTNKEKQINTIIYSAMQKNLLEKLEDIFKRQGLKLVAIESSYASFIRGLSVSGLVDDCIEKNLNWCVLLIKNNNNAAIILKGSQVLNIIESPMALNSLETDDLYSALSSSLLEKIEDTEVESLVVINYSRIVNTKNLVTYFDFKCPIIKIENNLYKGEPLYSYGLDAIQEPISPEVIGSSCYRNAPVKFGFNFLSTQGQDEMPGFLSNLGVTGNPLHLILIGLIAIIIVLIGLISLITLPLNASLDGQYSELTTKCNQYKDKVAKPQSKVFNLFKVVQTGFTNNEKIITSYDAISAVIPEKVWITSIKIDENSNASIQGKAYSVEDIVSYYENLLSVSKFNNLKIKSIKVVGETSGVDNNSPDVSVKAVGNNSAPALTPPQQPGNILPGAPVQGSSMLPPPPSSIASGNPIDLGSDSKYYEFDFGTSSEVPSVDTNKPQGQEKTLVPDLSKLVKK